MNVKEQTRQITKVKEVLSAEIMFARNEINTWPALSTSKKKHELELTNFPEQDGQIENTSRIESLLLQKQPRLSDIYTPFEQKKHKPAVSKEEVDERQFFPMTQVRKADYINDRSAFHCELVLGERPTKALLRVYHGHIGAVNSISLLTFDAKEHLFTGSNDATCRMYDTTTGACVRVFEGHQGVVNSIFTKILPGFYCEFQQSRDVTDKAVPTWNEDRLDILSFTLDRTPKTMTIRVFSRELSGSKLQAKLEVLLTTSIAGPRQEWYTLPLTAAHPPAGLSAAAAAVLPCCSAQQMDCALLVEEEWRPTLGGATLTLLLKHLLHLPLPPGAQSTYVSVCVRDKPLPRLASGSGDRSARLRLTTA
jgi:hypothetical protein